MVQHKDRHVDKWNRIESPEMYPQVCGQMIFDRVPKPFDGEKVIFSTNGTGENGCLHAKE